MIIDHFHSDSKDKQKNLFLDKSTVSYLSLSFSKSGFLSKDELREINIALKKQKTKMIVDLKKTFLSKSLSKKIVLSLLKMKLSKLEIKLILKLIKKIMHDLFRKPFDRISLYEFIKFWNHLPLTLKRFLIAIQVLKDEMINSFFLRLNLANRQKIKVKKNLDIQLINTIEEERSRFLLDVGMNPNISEKNSSQNKKTKEKTNL